MLWKSNGYIVQVQQHWYRSGTDTVLYHGESSQNWCTHTALKHIVSQQEFFTNRSQTPLTGTD